LIVSALPVLIIGISERLFSAHDLETMRQKEGLKNFFSENNCLPLQRIRPVGKK